MSGTWNLGEIFVMLPIQVLSQHAGRGPMDGYHHMMSFWADGVIGGLVLVVIVGAMVYVIVRNLGSSQADDISPNEAPLEILKKRYARGEITKEEFEKMRQSL